MLADLSRVWVVGTSCSGKSTLAVALSEALGVPLIEMDALHWGPNWTEKEDFSQRLDEATAQSNWVCAGNYGKVRHLVMPRATCVVWLDLPFGLVFGRSLRRTFRRAWTGEVLFNGCREDWRMVLSPDWIPWWVMRTHGKNRREYSALFADGQVEVVRLRSKAEVTAWLASVKGEAED